MGHLAVDYRRQLVALTLALLPLTACQTGDQAPPVTAATTPQTERSELSDRDRAVHAFTLADLSGSYAGSFESRGTSDGNVYFRDNPALEIDETGTAKWNGQPGSGTSPVTIGDDGKTATFALSGDPRTFAISMEDGKVTLRTKYRSSYQGWQRDNLLVFSKTERAVGSDAATAPTGTTGTDMEAAHEASQPDWAAFVPGKYDGTLHLQQKYGSWNMTLDGTIVIARNANGALSSTITVNGQKRNDVPTRIEGACLIIKSRDGQYPCYTVKQEDDTVTLRTSFETQSDYGPVTNTATLTRKIAP